MVSRGGRGRLGSRWSVSARTFRRERPPHHDALRSLFGLLSPRFCGARDGFRQGRRAGRSRPLFGPSLFSGGSGRVGWSGGGEAEGGTIPSGGAGRAQCLPGEGRGGLLGTVGWGEIVWARDSARARAGAFDAPPLPSLSQAVVLPLPWLLSMDPGVRHPGPQLPRREWRQKTKASGPLQVMNRSVKLPVTPFPCKP